MAVTTTVQDILDAAFAKSTKNQPGTIATSETELLNVVIRTMRGVYAFAARINPYHFSVRQGVGGVAADWERPERAEAIIRIEQQDTTEVIVVPLDDRLAAEPKPSLYEFEGVFTADGAQTNPPGGTDTLVFFYAKRPDDPTPPADLAGVLDPDWDEAYNELLILEVAIYLALKDGRSDEVQLLKGDRNQWAQLFGSYLQHATANLQRRFGHRRIVNVETLLPLLTGGA